MRLAKAIYTMFAALNLCGMITAYLFGVTVLVWPLVILNACLLLIGCVHIFDRMLPWIAPAVSFYGALGTAIFSGGFFGPADHTALSVFYVFGIVGGLALLVICLDSVFQTTPTTVPGNVH